MSFEGLGPVAFGGGVSMVTASLGANDPALGTIKVVGGREYIFVYNAAANSNIEPGYGAVLISGATDMSCTVSAVTSADAVMGVCRNATLTTGTYGWLVRRGITPVVMNATSGSVSALGLIEIAANGDFSPVSLTTGNLAPACGKALEAIVSSASGSAYVSCF